MKRFSELVLIPCEVVTFAVAVESRNRVLSNAPTAFIVFTVPVFTEVVYVCRIVFLVSGLTKVFNVSTAAMELSLVLMLSCGLLNETVPVSLFTSSPSVSVLLCMWPSLNFPCQL